MSSSKDELQRLVEKKRLFDEAASKAENERLAAAALAAEQWQALDARWSVHRAAIGDAVGVVNAEMEASGLRLVFDGAGAGRKSAGAGPIESTYVDVVRGREKESLARLLIKVNGVGSLQLSGAETLPGARTIDQIGPEFWEEAVRTISKKALMKAMQR